MKVTQVADTITHAVIGGQQEEEFEVNNSAEFFHILSDALYTNKPLATVRETLCNAWDAMIEAGKEDQPIKITLTASELTIQDFGDGIPDKLMKPLYGTYGGTSKQSNANVTGGFGLGCKSPFSICDHFEVISCHDGIKSIWRISKSSGERAGKPSIKKIMSAPTTETGVTVKIPISRRHDDTANYGRHHFNTMATQLDKAIRGVVYYGAMVADYSYYLGEEKDEYFRLPIFSMPFDAGSTGLASVKDAALGTSGVYVRYGNVIYPLPEDEHYARDVELAKKVLEISKDSFIILQAVPDSIAIAPSREALSLTDTTKSVIKGLLEDFNKSFRKEAREVFEKVIEYNYERADVYELLSNPDSLFRTGNMPVSWDPKKRKWVPNADSGIPTSASTDVVINALDTTTGYGHYGTRANLMRLLNYPAFSTQMSSLKKALDSGHFNKDHMREWIKITRWHDNHNPTSRSPHAWRTKNKTLRKFLRKDVFYRLQAGVQEVVSEYGSRHKVGIVLMDSGCKQTYQNRYKARLTFQNPFKEAFLPHPSMLRPMVILAHSRTRVDERFKHYPELYEFGSSSMNTIVVTIPRIKDDKDYISDVILKLNRLGYHVADMTSRQYFEPRIYFERVKKEVESRKRGAGFYSLYNYTQTFGDIPEDNRMHNPKFFIRMDRGDDIEDALGLYRKELLDGFPLLCRYTAVVYSDTDQRRVEKEGAKDIKRYIEKLILNAMKVNHNLRKVLKFIDYDKYLLSPEENAAIRRSNILLSYITRIRFLREKYLGIPELSDADKRMLNVITALREKRTRSYMADGTGMLPAYFRPEDGGYCADLVNKIGKWGVIPASPRLLSLAKKLSESVVLNMVQEASLGELARTAKTKSDKDRIIKMINFIIQGN